MNASLDNLRGIGAIMAVGLVSFAVASPSADPAVEPATVAAATQPAGSVLPEQYQILLKRNIFCRNGDPRAQAPAASAGASLPLQNFVLRGIVHQDDEFIAIFEDMATNQVQHLRAGQTLARAAISRITLAGVEFAPPAKLQAIAVGQNLAGEVSVPPPVVEPAAVAHAPEQAPGTDAQPDPIQARAVMRMQKMDKNAWQFKAN